MYAHGTSRNSSNNFNVSAPAASVCGRLEPHGRSKQTKGGWRYLQCADSLDELRVLIPPRPAAIYANLLKIEAHVLAQHDAESLRDAQYIHLLKEAMVKKCRKLAQRSLESDPQATSIIAPPDFRLKRLEQWWEEREKRGMSAGVSDLSKGRQSSYATPLEVSVSPRKAHRMSSNGRAVPSTQKNHSSFVKKQSSSRLPDQNPNTSPRTYHTTKSAKVAALPTHDVGNSLNGSRKRLPHLTVSSSTHSSPEQFSPSKSSTAEPYTPIQHSHIASPLFASPHTYERTPRNSPQKSSPDRSLTYRPLYTNSQSASPLETPHNPYFDPNRSLASQTGHQEPSSPRSRRTFASEHYSSFPEPYSPTHVVRNESSQGASEPLSNRGIQSHHFADTSYAPANAQADPSLLKSQFQATYLASPSNSNSPSSNTSKFSSTPHHPSRGSASAFHIPRSHLHVGHGQDSPTRNQAHKSFTVSYSTNIPPSGAVHAPPAADKEHRRRATVDCDDTDRSVPRPKDYMYRSSDAHHINEYVNVPPSIYCPYDNQGAHHDGDNSPSTLRRISRALKQSFKSVGSPLSSESPSNSSHSHGSSSNHYVTEGAHHGQDNANRALPSQRMSPVPPAAASRHPDNAMNAGSSSHLLPEPALQFRLRRGSNDSSGSATRANPVAQQIGNVSPKLQHRRSASRQVLGDANSGAQAVEPKSFALTEPDSHHLRGRSPKGSLTAQFVTDEITHRPELRHNENLTRTHFVQNNSPRHVDNVMPESAATSPFQSKRNSRYTSGESSVSEPVIPDVSLIMEAELSKSKTERVRRRLVPFQTSSEEGGGHYASDSDLSELTSSDSEDEGEQDGRDGNFYRRPYRTRDGYGSGYASDARGGQSRPASRPASRSPSRGILKRSSSACSQRSNKSVRIEIPKDRKALEEVREAEDKVDSAKRRLQDLRKRKGTRFTVSDADVLKAAEAVDEAERSLKDKEDAYRVILESMKRSQPDQEMGPRYV